MHEYHSDMDLPAEQRISALRSTKALLDQFAKAREASLSERRTCRCTRVHGITSGMEALALDIQRSLGWEDDG